MHSFAMGIIVTFVYDWFVILRRLFRHSMFWISIEDIIFWIGCTFSVFGMLYEENNGMLRWFAVAGATLGMLIYKKTASPFLIKTAVKVFTVLGKVSVALGRRIWKPVGFLLRKAMTGCRKAGKKGAKTGRWMKKKLTVYGKILKMILCKQ